MVGIIHTYPLLTGLTTGHKDDLSLKEHLHYKEGLGSVSSDRPGSSAIKMGIPTAELRRGGRRKRRKKEKRRRKKRREGGG